MANDGKSLKMRLSEARKRWGNRPTIAAQGAQVKRTMEDGSKVIRLLFDGTHGVELNTQIRQRDSATMPRAGDAACAMRALAEEKCGAFGLTADADAAHQAIAVDERDWPLQAVSVEDPNGAEDVEIHVHKFGTYGISSISYWWACMAACLVGFFCYTLPPGAIVWLLIYADDFNWMAGGKDFVQLLLKGPLLLLVFGLRLSCRKAPEGWHTTGSALSASCAISNLESPSEGKPGHWAGWRKS